MRIFVAALFIALAQSTSFGDKVPLNLSKASFPSPDGKYLAKIQHGEDNWTELNVTDMGGVRVGTTNHIYFVPVYSLNWTHDSRSIIVVGHIGHGSAAMLFHLEKGDWAGAITFPPNFRGDRSLRVFYDVTHVVPDDHDVHLIYHLSVGPLEAAKGDKRNFYSADVCFDPITNKFLYSKLTPLN